MKDTKELKKQKGITLIALIITIIVMLILVAVTISMAVNGGLFTYAQRAGTQTNEAIKKEQELASGKINIGGETFDTIDDYTEGKRTIYAILYEDGTLVFNSTGKKQEGKNVLVESGIIDKEFSSMDDIPWKDHFIKINKVIIEDKIRPATTKAWFYGCESLTEIVGINKLNTSLCSSMHAMFAHCESLVNLDVSGFNTTNVENMNYMFSNCISLTQIDLSNFNTSNVENMKYMFSNCISLTQIDLSNFNTSNAKDMSGMFFNCTSLTEMDLNNFNTSSVKDMSGMFASDDDTGCMNIKEIKGLNKFNTSSVEDMNSMFQNCTKLTSIDVSSFNTSNVTDMSYMFCGTNKNIMDVEAIKGLSQFNTSKVENMLGMFHNCAKLTSIDISSFNTSNVHDMRNMFYNCDSLKRIFIPKTFSRIEISDSAKTPFYETSSDLKIYCEAEEKPAGWINDWNKRTESDCCDVQWGVTKTQYDAL